MDIPEIIKGLGTAVNSMVPTLDASKHGWWRLAILVGMFGAIAGGLIVVWKTDTNRALDSVIEFRRLPEHDNIQAPTKSPSPCKEIGDSLECL